MGESEGWGIVDPREEGRGNLQDADDSRFVLSHDVSTDEGVNIYLLSEKIKGKRIERGKKASSISGGEKARPILGKAGSNHDKR